MSSTSEGTRETILRAARRVLEKVPEERVRLSDIADEAGYSRQTLYLHFGSRSNLFVALVQYIDEVENLDERARPVWEASSGREALREMIHLTATYTPRVLPAATVLVRDRYRDEDLAEAYEDRMEERRRACRRLILWLERDGALAPEWDVDSAVDVLFSLISIQQYQVLVVDRGWSANRFETHLWTLAKRSLLDEGG